MDFDIDEALVREATQNSQDASASETSPVRVRIAVSRDASLDAGLLHDLVSPIQPRLSAAGYDVDLPARPSAVVIEDFGTTGLTGDWEDEKDTGPFRSFWFRLGSSSKGKRQGGRWGLGKLVFPMSSHVRCHFGLTLTRDASEPLLLGQAVLKTHRIGERKFAPMGNWGALNRGGVEPVRDARFSQRFREGFGLQRTNEPGFSVVVPWPRGEIEKEQLIQYVVENYAFPILTERLLIDVMGETIDRDAVLTIGQRLLPPGLIDFIDDVNTVPESTLFQASSPRLVNQTYQLDEKVFGELGLTELRRRYAAGERIGVRLPVSLRRKADARGTDSFVDVHLKAALEGEKGAALCVRGDITVPEEANRFRNETHFALLMAREPTMSEFLGDAENPAHTKWDQKERLNASWRDYPTHKLRLIKNCVQALHRVLAVGKSRSDANALVNFFWADDPENGKGGRAKAKRKKGPRIQVPKPPELPRPERLVNITKVAGGFSVAAGPGFAARPKPARLRLEIAYDVVAGNPFKSWSPFDFDLGTEGSNITIQAENAKVSAKGRHVSLTIPRSDFRLTATGFDPRRDVVVQWTWPQVVADA